MIIAALYVYIVITAIAQLLCDCAIMADKCFVSAKIFWEDGNPLLAIMAVPLFLIGCVFFIIRYSIVIIPVMIIIAML